MRIKASIFNVKMGQIKSERNIQEEQLQIGDDPKLNSSLVKGLEKVTAAAKCNAIPQSQGKLERFQWLRFNQSLRQSQRQRQSPIQRQRD